MVMRTIVSFIYVNYNSGKYLYNSINSIHENFPVNDNIDYEIIVFDNASTDESANYNFKKCTVYKNSVNLGFAKANNLAVKFSKGQILYFINPDTIFKSINIEENINLLLDKRSRIGIVSPLVIYPNNNIQYTSRKDPTLMLLLPHLLGISKFIYFNYKYNSKYYNKKFYPDWVSGCAFMISKELYLEINGFDEQYFLYWEDVDLCKRINLKGYKVLFNPNHIVIHYENISSKKVKYFSKLHEIKGRLLYFSIYKNKISLVSIYILSIINLFLLYLRELLIYRNSNNEFLKVLRFFLSYKIIFK